MNAQTFEKQANTLKAIAHPTRLQIMLILKRTGEASVSVICKSLGLEQSLVSHHLITMKDKGVLQSRRIAKQMLYSLTDRVRMGEDGAVMVDVERNTVDA